MSVLAPGGAFAVHVNVNGAVTIATITHQFEIYVTAGFSVNAQ